MPIITGGSKPDPADSMDKPFPYLYEENVDIPLRTFGTGLVRANVYRPYDSNDGVRYPVLLTYGPYGKDAPYELFNNSSYKSIHTEHKSAHSSWETPHPGFWTERGYAVVRADEEGTGQSPGILNTFSSRTAEGYHDVVEWAASQPWSTGKVALLGISYFAASQWFVAAKRPKGLAAIVPWEGFTDSYRDFIRHGGILSSHFYDWWWHTEVLPNQYGRPRPPGFPFPESIDGRRTDKELQENMVDQFKDIKKYKFRDDPYWVPREVDLEQIEVPLLSIGNWGAFNLHLRGNVQGYIHAKSRFKFLYFITGRHDCPFYYPEYTTLQKSFLDAFLKDQDHHGWTVPGQVPPVNLILREGDVGFDDYKKEKSYKRRTESAWPLPGTVYETYVLTKDLKLAPKDTIESYDTGVLRWNALDETHSGRICFQTPPFSERTEFTGHVTAHLNVSLARESKSSSQLPSDLDLFLTIRHFGPDGPEISYTGPTGRPVPVTKGWLRLSRRKTDPSHPHHRPYLPYRQYRSSDVGKVVPGEVYAVDVEIIPTNVVVSPGGSLVFEISGADTQGSGIFMHNDPEDRPASTFEGWNELHFSGGADNFLTLPRIPSNRSL